MRKSLFVLIRSADGRSLARALVVLMLVNALIGGFHAGAMAASGDGVICTAGVATASDAGADRDVPGPDRDPSSCCIFGCAGTCSPTPAALPEPSPAAVLSQPLADVTPLDAADQVPSSPRAKSSPGARAPPLPA